MISIGLKLLGLETDILQAKMQIKLVIYECAQASDRKVKIKVNRKTHIIFL